MPTTKLLFYLPLFLATACGSNPATKPCAGIPQLGRWWYEAQNDWLTLDADCHGTNAYCQYDFQYTPPNDATPGITYLTLNSPISAQANGCFDKGNPARIQCTWSMANINTLSVQCGSLATTYLRQP